MDTTNDSSVSLPQEGLISEAVRDVFIVVNYIFLMGIICFMGIIFNIINIIVFAKQGLHDAVNITLLGLAVADLCSVTAHFWQSICYNLWFFGSSTTINFKHVQYITASWPSGMFGRISSWLTVLISFERCLCVALPLHVKRIITPTRVIIVNVIIYISMIALNMPIFYSVGLKYYHFPQYNRTMLGFFYRERGVKIEQVCLALLGTSQMVSFALIVIFTAILSARLKHKMKWRHSVTSQAAVASDSVSAKDKKVSKMVVAICLLFVCLLSPYWFSGMAMSIFPEYNNLESTESPAAFNWSSAGGGWNPFKSVLNSCSSLAFSLGSFLAGETPIKRSLILTNIGGDVKEEQPKRTPPTLSSSSTTLSPSPPQETDSHDIMQESRTDLHPPPSHMDDRGEGTLHKNAKLLEDSRMAHLGEGDVKVTMEEANKVNQNLENDDTYYTA